MANLYMLIGGTSFMEIHYLEKNPYFASITFCVRKQKQLVKQSITRVSSLAWQCDKYSH